MKKLLNVTMLLTLLVCVSILAETPLIDPVQKPDACYCLFRTTNMWTFIKLDTRDGRMWQVQFDIKSSNRHNLVLNEQVLADSKNQRPGRFTLYPTSNMYNFILLDQIDGRTWQVQWSTEADNRVILPIKDLITTK